MDTTWDTISRLTARLDAHGGLPEDQRRLLQILKIQEEAGEVAEAVIGAMGQNPRKGVSHTWQDVESEICDLIITGMVALKRLSPDAEAAFQHHLKKIADRDLA